MHLPNGLPDDLPEDYAAANARYLFEPAEPQEVAKFDKPLRVGGANDEMLERAWAPARKRYQELHERIRSMDPGTPHELPPEMEAAVQVVATGRRVVGIAGLAGSGKNAAASMIPGACVLQLADPLYAMLSAMLGIPANYTQAALLPVAWLTGGDLKPAKRLPVEEVTYWGRWGQWRE